MQIKISRIFSKTLITIIIVLLIASCAIHDKFPFICFRWSCIAAEFKLPSVNASAMKKQRKSRASARKKKRQRARNKRAREKGNVVSKPNYSESNTQENKNEEPPAKKDSLKYSFTTVSEDKYIVIKFFKTDPPKVDSILIKYPDDGDEISAYDKQTLKNYVDSNKVEKIAFINLREHVGTKEEDKHKNKHITPIKRNILDYFIQLGVPREKIRVY